MTQTTTRKPRRMAREKQPQPQAQAQTQEKSSAPGDNPASAVKALSRLDQLQALLARPDGATIAEMVEATGWQQHSVRGAMAGALKKHGVMITSTKIEGVRRYRADVPA
jgi:hypothetical protein